MAPKSTAPGGGMKPQKFSNNLSNSPKACVSSQEDGDSPEPPPPSFSQSSISYLHPTLNQPTRFDSMQSTTRLLHIYVLHTLDSSYFLIPHPSSLIPHLSPSFTLSLPLSLPLLLPPPLHRASGVGGFLPCHIPATYLPTHLIATSSPPPIHLSTTANQNVVACKRKEKKKLLIPKTILISLLCMYAAVRVLKGGREGGRGCSGCRVLGC